MTARASWLLLLALALPAGAAEPILGFSYPVWQREQYASPRTLESLARLADTGAGWVVIIPTVHTPGRRSSQVLEYDGTASESSLRLVIRAAKARGLKVLLKPHVDTP